jgi:hypothetical protein
LMPLALNNFINSRNRHNYRNNRNAERMAWKKNKRKDTSKKTV